MPIADYTPALDDVGGLVRSRTVDANGNELGTFVDGQTRPTASEASVMISEAVNESYPVLGEDIPDAPGSDPNALRTSAKRIVALRAAALVELSYYPEQVARGNSPYEQYMTSYNQGLERLEAAIAEVNAGDDPGSSGANQVPQFDFPEDAGGVVGWGTAW
jgi:hypothetical protein